MADALALAKEIALVSPDAVRNAPLRVAVCFNVLQPQMISLAIAQQIMSSFLMPFVLQCVAMCCSVLQCVAVRFSVLQPRWISLTLAKGKIRVFTDALRSYTYICVYMYIHVCVYTYTVCVYMHVYIYVYIHVCVYAYMYVCIPVYTYVCVYIHV